MISRAVVGLRQCSSFLSRAVVEIFGAARTAARAWHRRRDVLALASLDDHMLKDIGITRTDVHAALGEPWFSDPSGVLATLSAERWRRTLAHSRQRRIVVTTPAQRRGAGA